MKKKLTNTLSRRRIRGPGHDLGAVRVGLTFVASVVLLVMIVAGSPLGAELVKFTHGAHMNVDSYKRLGSKAELRLPRGGVLVVPASKIAQVKESEIEIERDRAPRRYVILDNPLETLDYDRSQSLPDMPYVVEIYRASKRYGINPYLVAAVISTGSDFDPHVVSPFGRGLMVLHPNAAAATGVATETLLDPKQNIDAGTRYLKRLIDLYRGDLAWALASYRTGGEELEEWRDDGFPADAEVRTFIQDVYADLNRITDLMR